MKTTMAHILLIWGLTIALKSYSQVPTAGLVGYYPFTGNANDASPTANNGIVHGAVLAPDRYGNANACYRFDGVDDYISIANRPTYDFKSYTISLWFKYLGPSANTSQHWELINKNATKNSLLDPFSIAVFNPAKEPDNILHARAASGTTRVNTDPVRGENYNQWHHVAILFDNNSNLFRLYLDGVRRTSNTGAFDPVINTSNINIGRWEGYLNYFKGLIDDVRIYNVPLTESQLNSLYQAELFAQLPSDYVIRPTTKQYKNIGMQNPLVKMGPIDVLAMNGRIFMEGDIYLGTTQELDRLQSLQPSIRVDDNILFNSRWGQGVVPFVILDGFSIAENEIIINAMNHISQLTHVCFIPKTNETNYIKFKKYTVQELGFAGGASWLGKCTVCPDGQEVQLSFVSDIVVRHELCHALGLMHEQSREDRDRFVEILYDNIMPGFEIQFAQANIIATDIGSYDFNSIMHYPANAFGKRENGSIQQTIRRISNPSDRSFGTSSVLSAIDITGINSMYPNEQSCTNLTVLAPNELAIGVSKTVSVSANQPYNKTDVFVRNGQEFRMTTASPGWNNGKIETDCKGYKRQALDLPRHLDLNMMSLVGEIFSQNNTSSYTGSYFEVGCGPTTVTPQNTGYLIVFANDNLSGYKDNSRVVTLTITRTR